MNQPANTSVYGCSSGTALCNAPWSKSLKQSPESGPIFSAKPRSTVLFKSANPLNLFWLNLSLKSVIRG